MEKNKIQEAINAIMSIRKNNHIVVYTAIFGGYDKLLDPEIVENDVDYICFTDNKELTSKVWFIVFIGHIDIDPRRTAKYFKIMPHIFFPDYECSVWVDGSVRITGNIRIFLNDFSYKYSMSCIKHPQRTCAYQEAFGALFMGKILFYAYKANNFISEKWFSIKFWTFCGGILFRKHNSKLVSDLMDLWYEQTLKYSVRDQISLSYAIWYKNVPIKIYDINLYNNKFFIVKNHSFIKFYDNDGRNFKNIFSFISSLYLKIRSKF